MEFDNILKHYPTYFEQARFTDAWQGTVRLDTTVHSYITHSSGLLQLSVQSVDATKTYTKQTNDPFGTYKK